MDRVEGTGPRQRGRHAGRAGIVGFVVGALLTGALVVSVAAPDGLDGDAAFALLEDRVIGPLEAAGHEVRIAATMTDPGCTAAPDPADATEWYLAARLEVSGSVDEVRARFDRDLDQVLRREDVTLYRQGGGGAGTWGVHLQHHQHDGEVVYVTATLGGVDVSDGPPGAPWCPPIR